MPVLDIVHDEDPADIIERQAGDLTDIHVFNNQVLVGIYLRDGEGKSEARTASGLIVPNKVTEEDKYQSKTGIILKMGPTAFHDPNENWFFGEEFFEGDWVVFRPSDGWALTLVSRDERGKPQKLLCRLMDDVCVRARIGGDSPADRVY